MTRQQAVDIEQTPCFGFEVVIREFNPSGCSVYKTYNIELSLLKVNGKYRSLLTTRPSKPTSSPPEGYINPDDATLKHRLIEVLESRIDTALNSLGTDFLIYTTENSIELDAKMKGDIITSIRKDAVGILDRASKNTRLDWGVRRGGNRRTKPAWKDENILILFAQRVDERYLLVQCMEKVYDDCYGEAGWIEDLGQDVNFIKLSLGVPGEIISQIIKRVANDGLPPRDKESRSISCEVARWELGLDEQSIETLRDYYGKGKKLIQTSRRQPNQ